jgi:2-polyprenyl-3-methyl-5-hydroxy-6-metoxy-1,4-benzoquinol methylase
MAEESFSFHFDDEPTNSEETNVEPAKQFIPSEQHLLFLRQQFIPSIPIDAVSALPSSVHLVRLNGASVQHYLHKHKLCELQLANTDLIAGIYEGTQKNGTFILVGGFKLWECAIDLIQYLHEQLQPELLKGKRVLDIGCGHGLPGLYTLLYAQASHVEFQDYNEQVLQYLTCANVLANSSGLDKVQFWSGDWSALAKEQQQQNVDVILTSDTLYNPANQKKLLNYIKARLNPIGGMALIASKSYYFGVGGSVHSFLQLISQDSSLQVTQVQNKLDGHSNVREILCVRYKYLS